MKFFKTKEEKRQIKIEKLRKRIRSLENDLQGWEAMLRWVDELPMARLDQYRWDVSALKSAKQELAELLGQ